MLCQCQCQQGQRGWWTLCQARLSTAITTVACTGNSKVDPPKHRRPWTVARGLFSRQLVAERERGVRGKEMQVKVASHPVSGAPQHPQTVDLKAVLKSLLTSSDEMAQPTPHLDLSLRQTKNFLEPVTKWGTERRARLAWPSTRSAGWARTLHDVTSFPPRTEAGARGLRSPASGLRQSFSPTGTRASLGVFAAALADQPRGSALHAYLYPSPLASNAQRNKQRNEECSGKSMAAALRVAVAFLGLGRWALSTTARTPGDPRPLPECDARLWLVASPFWNR